MAVYADVLVVVNYIVNLLLILTSGKILGVVLKRWRVSLAALIGGLGSLLIFLPVVGMGMQIILKLSLTFAMVSAAFGCKPWKRFAKAVFVLFSVSFIFAGLMLALSFFAAPVGMLFYNGIVYFDISALTLILCTTAAYLLMLLFESLFFSRTAERKLCDITVTSNGKTIMMKGLVDNGCNLKEPFSGAPVIVCDRTLANKIRPEHDVGMRVIPCLTVTGEGVLEGFRPDHLLLHCEGKTMQTADVYIAASREAIEGEYQALINPQLMNRV